ncbi:MAG: shikimate kinase [Rhodothermales bacterium]|nr:shikimate kinase [Rhodothermales bacterium]
MTAERIYMTGFMGSGKSTVGPRVARLLGFDSMDLDTMIEEDLGMSIPAIFDVLGEDAFRSAEREHLARVGSMNRLVVSLGGGTILHAQNLQFCLDTGILITLDVDIDTLADRLEQSPNPRPLLFDESGNRLSGDRLRRRIGELLAERRPAYEQAHHLIAVGNEDAEVVAERVVGLLRAGLF